MYYDKERTTKLIEYMRETNKSWVRGGVQTDIAAKSDPKARFSFRKFLVEHNLFVNPMEKSGDIWIECPFHEDVSPSCSINEDKWVYHCFSCGSHGNLISLITDYRNKYEDANVRYYNVLNQILVQDPITQAELGFDNLVVKGTADSFDFNGHLEPFRFKAPTGSVAPTSYVELADKIKRDKLDEGYVKLFIILMQAHVDVKEIYKEIYKSEDSAYHDDVKINLNELLEF